MKKQEEHAINSFDYDPLFIFYLDKHLPNNSLNRRAM